MGNIIFQQILHLVAKGFEVKLTSPVLLPGRPALKIELSDGYHHHAQVVDFTDAAQFKLYNTKEENVEYVISRALSVAEHELEYYITKEKFNND